MSCAFLIRVILDRHWMACLWCARMQSGHCEWDEFTPDLRDELLASGKKLAESRPVDAHGPPLGASYVCDHSKKVCSFCRDWLLGSHKKCTGHPEDKCGKASCCVSHYNYRETRPKAKKMRRSKQCTGDLSDAPQPSASGAGR